jgi:hypothetical protein
MLYKKEESCLKFFGDLGIDKIFAIKYIYTLIVYTLSCFVIKE